ncbi:MAG: hypothetical protein MUP41_07975 [Desulfobacterales bacterium]|nr:hypothetical protein [Desulfobacterales bacterium]
MRYLFRCLSLLPGGLTMTNTAEGRKRCSISLKHVRITTTRELAVGEIHSKGENHAPNS